MEAGERPCECNGCLARPLSPAMARADEILRDYVTRTDAFYRIMFGPGEQPLRWSVAVEIDEDIPF